MDALTFEGHQVTDAVDGVEALELVEQSSLEPQVLVTDIRMPRMSGPDLAKRLRQKYPDLVVVFATGYDDPGEAWADERTAILNKPFSGDEVLATIQRLRKR